MNRDLNNLSIWKIEDLTVVFWADLLAESENQGFRFLRRLEEEFKNGSNRFDKRGEAIYGVFTDSKQLIALGGVNRGNASENSDTGRLRRFYVLSQYRGFGVGKFLLERILIDARNYFEVVELYTDTDAAARFYSSNGFFQVYNDTQVTHRIRL